MSGTFMNRRTAVASLGGMATCLLPALGRAQSGLNMSTIVVGLAAGGATDAAARRLAEGLRGSFAKTVIVENRTGAGARLAPQFVKTAQPSGATLLLTPASMMAIYPHTYKNPGYDSVRDFTPVGIVSTTDLGFAVGPGVPATVKTIGDFLNWAKTNAAGANFGSGAAGSGPHFLGELLARGAGVKMVHVGYRGSQPAILDMLGGHIPAVSAPLGEFLPHLKSGQLRVLAVTGPKRTRFLPEVPTFKELGIPLSDMTEWFGVFLPAGAPAALTQQVSASIKSALANPELVSAFGLMGMEAVWSSPEELTERLRADIQRWRGVVEQIGFTAES